MNGKTIIYQIEKYGEADDPDELICIALTGDTYGAKDIIKELNHYRWDAQVAPGMEKAWRTKMYRMGDKEAWKDEFRSLWADTRKALTDANRRLVRI